MLSTRDDVGGSADFITPIPNQTFWMAFVRSFTPAGDILNSASLSTVAYRIFFIEFFRIIFVIKGSWTTCVNKKRKMVVLEKGRKKAAMHYIDKVQWDDDASDITLYMMRPQETWNTSITREKNIWVYMRQNIRAWM